MYSPIKGRIVIPAAAAILLTFGRSGILPVEGVYNLLDQLMNVFVVFAAPIFAIKNIFPHPKNHNLQILMPLFLLAIWVIACVVFGSPYEYWPSQTAFISIAVSILIASQVNQSDLRRVRHFILLLTGLFCLFALLYGQNSLKLVLSGSMNQRLGIDISSANVIIFPRTMYMLIVTCLISVIIEKKLWVKISSACLTIIPFMFSIATGGRGPLVGAVAALLVFVLALGNRVKSLIAVAVAGLVFFVGNDLVLEFFPVMQHRITEEGDSGRFDIWKNVIDPDNVSLFGQGVAAVYPHNIFLEFFFTYGIFGLVLFLIFLTVTVKTAYKHYLCTRDPESLWALSLFVLQLTSQQFSLDIFYAGLWAAMVLPLGYGWNKACGSLPADERNPPGHQGLQSKPWQ